MPVLFTPFNLPSPLVNCFKLISCLFYASLENDSENKIKHFVINEGHAYMLAYTVPKNQFSVAWAEIHAHTSTEIDWCKSIHTQGEIDWSKNEENSTISQSQRTAKRKEGIKKVWQMKLKTFLSFVFSRFFSAWIYCNLAFEIEWEKDAEQKQRNPVLVFK